VSVQSIKQARKARGLSLTEVAERSGVHRMSIARAERVGVDVKASTLVAIAKALGVPICELFEESGHERQREKRQNKR
jgi:transcriptional regulator with XRE-family HTH domain